MGGSRSDTLGFAACAGRVGYVAPRRQTYTPIELTEQVRPPSPGGGFVFNTIRNVLPMAPVLNLLAPVNTLRQPGGKTP